MTTLKNGTNGVETEKVKTPVSKIFAEFTSDLKYESIPVEIRSQLKILLLDYIGVAVYGAHGAESSEPFYAATRALSAHGTATVFAKGATFQAQYAMLLNGAFSHTLDFDDTHLGGILHPGASVMTAALIEAESQLVTGKELLTAAAAGYEIACRLGVALGGGGFARGFHNTGTCGLFGAIVTIARLRNLSAKVTETALGVGISKAAGSMQYLQNGGWNKRLHPGFAAHDAYLCVAFAEAGVVSSTNTVSLR